MAGSYEITWDQAASRLEFALHGLFDVVVWKR